MSCIKQTAGSPRTGFLIIASDRKATRKMKLVISISVLALVVSVLGDAVDPSVEIISEMTTVRDSTELFATHLKQFLDSERKGVTSESKDRLKDLGGTLGDAEAKLSMQMRRLGAYLGILHAPVRNFGIGFG